MRIIKNIRSYILDEEFKVTILEGRINVVNYTSIGHFDNNKVIVKYDRGQIVIKGSDLVVTRLMSDEILISGNLSTIEFR